ncbi:IclR family transcriptional regulator [Holophaga foetida]|uniref:IclR family transcriptional regulator n=1 Tax=Holophaga foetida TaxID=35839 RepID=UPI0003160503|nr:IclR family transcriptional regulator [Holophaga foetida]
MIQVVARAADILFVLARHRDGLTLAALAQIMDLPRSTVQRIVKTLEESNLVIAASAKSGFRLGPALTLLANSVRPFDLVTMIHPFLVRLASETGETVELSILSHGSAVVVAQIHGTHALRVTSAVGSSLPLHGTAIGKAMLAALPEHELEALRRQMPLKPLTKNTIVTWEDMDRELASIRGTRVAFDREENIVGICSLGVAMEGYEGEMAAVSVLVPTRRFKANQEALAKAILNCCESFQRRM